jgi:hypothetical protein
MTNSFDQDAAQAVVEEIERELGLIKSSQAKHMKYARERRDVIKEIYKSAKEDGLPEDVVKGLLKIRDNNRSNAEVAKNMSSDYAPIFVPLSEALGLFADSPLGQAAAEAEKDMFEEEPEDAAAAAAANEAAEQAEGEQILDRKKAH